MEKYYVVGAQQKNGVYKDWEQYQKGVILKVSPGHNLIEKCIEYISPPEVIPQKSPSISFTAATIENNHLYVGTQTEILVYTLPNFQKLVIYHFLVLMTFIMLVLHQKEIYSL